MTPLSLEPDTQCNGGSKILRNCAVPALGSRGQNNTKNNHRSNNLGIRKIQEATKALQTKKSGAKAKSWKELLKGLDRDPLGRSFKIVLGKLRPLSGNLTW
ncbi:jg8096 [Pararge aegeria aegeria]|uniref:Jg8096 protein n=1 Tax=Pararge aegeria aegeria TaxID=348720 RepID=A0A8S4QNP9_9NEOP|nr:jg8096 [Pararge aegeria aegeria]